MQLHQESNLAASLSRQPGPCGTITHMQTPSGRKRPKILFIIDKWQAGGRQRVLQKLINGLDTERFETVLLTLAKPSPTFPLPMTRVIVLPESRLRSYVPRLSRVFRNEQPDIISSHLGIMLLPIMYFALILSRSKAAVTYTIQSVFDLNAYRIMFAPRFYKYLTSVALRSAAFVTASTNGMKEILTRDFHVPPSLIRIVPNPVYTKEPRHPSVGTRENAVHMLSIGRMAWPKDFSTILRSFKNAQDRSDAELSLQIIGDGTDREQLAKEAHELSAKDVIFCGPRTVDSETYAQADLFLFSSRSEGMPTVLIEALAAGVPCIATDCDFGPSELINDGKSGFLVPVGNVEAMTDAMLRLIGDKSLRDTFSENGPKMVEKYEEGNAVQAWEKMFLDCPVRQPADSQ